MEKECSGIAVHTFNNLIFEGVGIIRGWLQAATFATPENLKHLGRSLRSTNISPRSNHHLAAAGPHSHYPSVPQK